jgi:predicted metal-dependent peptidase
LETIIPESKVRGLILHENLHVALKQVAFGSGMFKEHRKMANLAADFVVNDIIENIKGCVSGTQERIVELPDGAVYDEMFHNWSMREVFNYLKKHAKPKPKPQPQKGNEQCNDPQSGGKQDKDDGDEFIESRRRG